MNTAILEDPETIASEFETSNSVVDMSTILKQVSPSNRQAESGSTLPPVPSMQQGHSIQAITEAVQQASSWVRPLQQEMGRVIVGQKYLIDRLIVGMVANGHLLLEGVPGLAKTLALKTLAGAIQANFSGSNSRRTCCLRISLAL